MDYLKVAAETDNVFQNTKYNLSRMLPTKCDVPTALPTTEAPSSTVTVADLGATKNNLQMFALWDLQNYYAQTQERFVAKAKELNLSSENAADESFTAPAPAHAYDDAFVAQQQFYCNTCHVQLLSDKDVALHKKGKKHKKKLRELSSTTVSEQIAKSAAAQVAQAESGVTTDPGSQLADDGNDETGSRALKRVKREDKEESASTKA